jgi:pimeloyl-ACP methyl ester carboxylesterase
VPRIDVIAASYGTRAALEYQRLFPASLRRAVLDGVAPPDMRLPDAAARDNQAALDALLDACAAEPACALAHPALRAHWLALLERLPHDVTLPHPLTGRPETVRLQRDSLLAMVRAPLYAPALAAALPMVIDLAASGRWAPLAALAGALGSGGAGAMATGLHFSVVCAEDLGSAAPPPDPADVAAASAPGNVFGASFATLYRQACADWPRGQVAADFYTLPPATAPTWLLSGGLDPVTPPRHGARVAQALGPQARHIVVANAGHGVTGLACLRDAVMRFIIDDDAAAALAGDADCAAAVPRPPAFVPPGIGAVAVAAPAGAASAGATEGAGR